MDIVLNLELIRKEGLSINEYLILYNVVNDHQISNVFDYSIEQLVKLEEKGYLKITRDGPVLRAKADKLFSVVSEDYFTKWLTIYPIKVENGRGGTRALSPNTENTVIGKVLRKKWTTLFKNNTDAQKQAVLVLELQLAEMKRSGDLMYMVEARRWLNEGFFEKYEYLIEEHKDRRAYDDEDHY